MNHKALGIPLLSLLVVVALLAMSLTQFVSAQSADDGFLRIDMAGVNSSFLTIGMANATDSRLIINSVIIPIELTGLHVYPISCSFGLLRPGDIRSTGEAFTLYNAGNVTLNVTIAVSGDWAGSTNWTHSDDCIPGVDTVGLVAIVEDTGGHTAIIVKKTEPYNYLATNLAPDERVTFALMIYAPTEFSDYSRKTNTIFVTISGGI